MQKIKATTTTCPPKCKGTRQRLGATILITTLLGLASMSAARADVFDDLFGSDKNFVEVPPAFPDAPQNGNLVPFYVSPETQFRFFIDQHSLSIGTDKVVHYTLVAVSNEGARNVSFEGMRCDGRLYKVYAYGRADGSFVARRDPVWSRIDEAEANRQRAALYKDYICPDGQPSRVAEIVRHLRVNPYNSIPID